MSNSSVPQSSKLRTAAVVLYVLGILVLLAGVLLFGAAGSAVAVGGENFIRILGIVSIILGVLYLVLGRGVRRGSLTAIYVAMALVALGAVSNLAQLGNESVNKGTPIISLVISAAVLWVLFRAREDAVARG